MTSGPGAAASGGLAGPAISGWMRFEAGVARTPIAVALVKYDATNNVGVKR